LKTNTRRLRTTALLLILGAAAGAVAMAAEKLYVESAWSAEAPVIDGKLADWPSPLVSLGSTQLSMGVRNDGSFLHVAFAASDPSARMILTAAGFTLWWDPAGKDKKAYGITVPPVDSFGRGMLGRGPGGGPPDQGGQPPDWQDPPPQGPGKPPQGQQGDPAQQGQEGRAGGPGGPGGPALGAIKSIEVLGPGKDDKRRLELAYARTIGIDAAVRMAEGVLVYELRVPLPVSEAQPYGVRSTPGATIGLGIETGKLQPPGGRGEEGGRGGMGGMPPGGGMGGGPPGGGGGGMGGGSRGGMGGGPPGGGREGMRELKPIKVWTTVHLAKAPA
jgi:hypothetical protein